MEMTAIIGVGFTSTLQSVKINADKAANCRGGVYLHPLQRDSERKFQHFQ